MIKPRPENFLGKVGLCWLAIFKPDRFDDLEREHNAALPNEPIPPPPRLIDRVRHALFGSFVGVATACIAGVFLGWISEFVFGHSAFGAASYAVIGAAVLLWATLAKQGWKIQTIDGETLTEKVNRWLFRGLYWFGTVMLAAATIWTIAD